MATGSITSLIGDTGVSGSITSLTGGTYISGAITQVTGVANVAPTTGAITSIIGLTAAPTIFGGFTSLTGVVDLESMQRQWDGDSWNLPSSFQWTGLTWTAVMLE